MKQDTGAIRNVQTSGQQLVHDVGTRDIGICESLGTSPVEIVQQGVVGAQLMEDGRVQIRDAAPVFHGSVTKFIVVP